MNQNLQLFIGVLSAVLMCCSASPLKTAGLSRGERSAGKISVPGSPSHVSIDDPEVRQAAQFAVNAISEGSGSENTLGLVQIVSATRQVVSGALFTIKLQAAKTDCSKAAPKPSCNVQAGTSTSSDPDFNECTVKVWDQPWLTPRYKITSVDCSRELAKPIAKKE